MCLNKVLCFLNLVKNNIDMQLLKLKNSFYDIIMLWYTNILKLYYTKYLKNKQLPKSLKKITVKKSLPLKNYLCKNKVRLITIIKLSNARRRHRAIESYFGSSWDLCELASEDRFDQGASPAPLHWSCHHQVQRLHQKRTQVRSFICLNC